MENMPFEKKNSRDSARRLERTINTAGSPRGEKMAPPKINT